MENRPPSAPERRKKTKYRSLKSSGYGQVNAAYLTNRNKFHHASHAIFPNALHRSLRFLAPEPVPKRSLRRRPSSDAGRGPGSPPPEKVTTQIQTDASPPRPSPPPPPVTPLDTIDVAAGTATTLDVTPIPHRVPAVTSVDAGAQSSPPRADPEEMMLRVWAGLFGYLIDDSARQVMRIKAQRARADRAQIKQDKMTAQSARSTPGSAPWDRSGRQATHPTPAPAPQPVPEASAAAPLPGTSAARDDLDNFLLQIGQARAEIASARRTVKLAPTPRVADVTEQSRVKALKSSQVAPRHAMDAVIAADQTGLRWAAQVNAATAPLHAAYRAAGGVLPPNVVVERAVAAIIGDVVAGIARSVDAAMDDTLTGVMLEEMG